MKYLRNIFYNLQMHINLFFLGGKAPIIQFSLGHDSSINLCVYVSCHNLKDNSKTTDINVNKDFSGSSSIL